MTENRDDYFVQPVDAIKVVSRAKSPRTLLTPEAFAEARQRVANGEDIDVVAEELAIERVALDLEAGR